jgi:hypothetical protein
VVLEATMRLPARGAVREKEVTDVTLEAGRPAGAAPRIIERLTDRHAVDHRHGGSEFRPSGGGFPVAVALLGRGTGESAAAAATVAATAAPGLRRRAGRGSFGGSGKVGGEEEEIFQVSRRPDEGVAQGELLVADEAGETLPHREVRRLSLLEGDRAEGTPDEREVVEDDLEGAPTGAGGEDPGARQGIPVEGHLEAMQEVDLVANRSLLEVAVADAQEEVVTEATALRRRVVLGIRKGADARQGDAGVAQPKGFPVETTEERVVGCLIRGEHNVVVVLEGSDEVAAIGHGDGVARPRLRRLIGRLADCRRWRHPARRSRPARQFEGGPETR